MASRWARVLRGIVAATFATGTAAGSHALAGGTVSAVGVAVALAFATVVSIALTGQRLSVWRLGASVGIAQFAFHTVFSLVSDGASVVQHGHHELMVTDATALPHLASTMWFGHLVAAVLTLVVLHFGERAFWRLAHLLFVRTRVVVPLDLPATPLLASPAFVVARPSRVDVASLGYRGPPVSFA